ncbi:ATP-dependent Clp protease proteolytic subunit, partial [Bacillus toyonensis]|nr:ATP-dependent Clp protease proteolytic subunit [Bacillus toyonensis]
MMIHEASTIVWGSKTLMRKEADMLEKLEDGIIDIYMTRANVEREEIRNMVNEETWFSANEAVEIGFATSTATTVEDNTNEELAQLKAQMRSMQNELSQYKNQSREPSPTAVKNSGIKGLFLKL